MITVLNGGVSAKHTSAFRMSRPKGLNNYVILIIRSDGEFIIGSNHFVVSPGQAVILAPGTPYFYGNPKGIYMDDWLHFLTGQDSPLSDNLPVNRPFFITNTELFTFLIKQILWEKSYGDELLSKQNIDALFSILCNHLIMALNKTSLKTTLSMPYQEQFQFIRLGLSSALSDNPAIEKYARELGISLSYFQHLYTTYFGVSFQQDLIRIRIEQAKTYLDTTDLSISQIAELCGYNSEVHFYRQFKKSVGMTPARFRKTNV